MSSALTPSRRHSCCVKEKDSLSLLFLEAWMFAAVLHSTGEGRAHTPAESCMAVLLRTHDSCASTTMLS